MRNYNLTLSFLLAVLISLHSSMVYGGIIFEHSGNADPTSEGWTHKLGSGGSTSSGPITNDLGLGVDAWFVEDTGTGQGTHEGYGQIPSGAQISEASSKGWRLSTNLRMVTGTVGSFFGMFMDYIDGTTTWLLIFDLDGNGDPVVRAFTGVGSSPSYTLTGAGSTYHTYSLQYDPLEGTADLFVDGVERISNYGGIAGGIIGVNWGATGSDATGRGHFNSVQWEIIPEPTTLTLATLSLLAVAFRSRYRRCY